MLVKCPSGFTYEARGLLTSEANILADMQAQQQGAVVDSILNSTYVRTVDPGPYKFPGAPVWEQVLSGDRFYAHMMVRVATHGTDFAFDIACPHCRSKIKWSIDLTTLDVQELAPADLATFTAGNKFEAPGPDGKLYTFHLSTGKHERKAQTILKQNPQSRITAALCSRIDAVEGVQVVATHINNLPFQDACQLLSVLDEHDCGIETDIDVTCTQCGAGSEVSLPFGSPGFWTPRAKKPRSF